MYRTRSRRDWKGKYEKRTKKFRDRKYRTLCLRTACGICCNIVGPPTMNETWNREEQRLMASTKTWNIDSEKGMDKWPMCSENKGRDQSKKWSVEKEWRRGESNHTFPEREGPWFSMSARWQLLTVRSPPRVSLSISDWVSTLWCSQARGLVRS